MKLNQITKLSILLPLLTTGSIHSTSSELNSNGINAATAISNVISKYGKRYYSSSFIKAVKQYHNDIIRNVNSEGQMHTCKLSELLKDPKKHILSNLKYSKGCIKKTLDGAALTARYTFGVGSIVSSMLFLKATLDNFKCTDECNLLTPKVLTVYCFLGSFFSTYMWPFPKNIEEINLRSFLSRFEIECKTLKTKTNTAKKLKNQKELRSRMKAITDELRLLFKRKTTIIYEIAVVTDKIEALSNKIDATPNKDTTALKKELSLLYREAMTLSKEEKPLMAKIPILIKELMGIEHKLNTLDTLDTLAFEPETSTTEIFVVS